MFRLLAIDMDGTLLTRERPLSECTRTALNSLIERGYYVVLATGRSFDLVRVLCPGVHFAGPQITFNGAVVFDPQLDRPLSRSLVPAEFVGPVVTFLLDAVIPVIACGTDTVYMDRRITRPDDWVAPSEGPGVFLDDMRQIPAEGLIKVVGDSDEDTITRIRPLAEAEFGSSLYVTQTSHRLIEFLNPDASKGAALREIAAWLGVRREETIAFGDSHNDLAMFEHAGLSVAMGNATEEVKAAADRVTLPYHEDGVVAALRELGLVETSSGED